MDEKRTLNMDNEKRNQEKIMENALNELKEITKEIREEEKPLYGIIEH